MDKYQESSEEPVDLELAAACDQARLDDLEDIQFFEQLRQGIKRSQTGALLEQLDAIYQRDIKRMGVTEAELPGTVWIKQVSSPEMEASDPDVEASELGHGELESARDGSLSEQQRRQLANALLGGLLGNH